MGLKMQYPKFYLSPIFFQTKVLILLNYIVDIICLSVGTASVSFARGQHLTRSCTPWRALPTTLSHEARPTHSFTCNSTSGLGGRPVLAPLSSSHEAAAALDIPSPSWDPSETVHSEVEAIINKASRTIIESISSFLWNYVPSPRRELE